jgi:hypothetical protein
MMSPPGMMPPPEMMPPPPGFGDPVGFLLPSLFKAVGGLFSRPRPALPFPPPPFTMSPPEPPFPMMSAQPMPGLFYSNRPQFCQMYCPPMPGMAQPMAQPGGGGRRHRRRRGSSRLGDPVGAIPLLAALAPLVASVLPGLIQRLTGGGQKNLSGYGYYGEPPPPGYAGW